LVDPQEAPDIDQFQSANRVVISDANQLGIALGSGCQYEAVTDSGWYMLGLATGGALLQGPMIYPTPLVILPMPAEYGQAWQIGFRYELGFPAPDTLMGGILDSVFVRLTIGGSAELDGWGIVRFSGGEVQALRQKISTGGSITLVGTRVIFGRRVEVEIPLGLEIQASQTYRWFAADVGEIASITSMLGEQDANFILASAIRVRRIIPAMTFPQGPLSFGEVHVGNSGMAQLSFSNHGEGIGIISRVEFSGGVGAEMEVITALPFVVPPDSSGRIRFLWTPTQERTLQGESLLLTHNDPTAQNLLTLPLIGNTPAFGVDLSTEPLQTFSLGENFPNPFNATTTVPFSLSQDGRVRLMLADALGRQIKQLAKGDYSAGSHNISVDLHDMPAGLYWLKLEAGGRSAARPILLLK